MQLGKLYTRGGDRGETHLVTGERVSKAHYLMDLTGSLDELNCHLGGVRTAYIAVKLNLNNHTCFDVEIGECLPELQNTLFDIGSLVACEPQAIPTGLPHIPEDLTKRLEKQIDRMNGWVKPLPSFVLPGGSELNARSHLARAVCRRVERLFVLHSANLHSRQIEQTLPFINRLSDWLFAFSRYSSLLENQEELLWQHPLNKIVDDAIDEV